MLVEPKAGIAEYVKEEDGKDLDSDWMTEDFVPTEDVDEELPWDKEEVLADENLHVLFNVKDLGMMGKE